MDEKEDLFPRVNLMSPYERYAFYFSRVKWVEESLFLSPSEAVTYAIPYLMDLLNSYEDEVEPLVELCSCLIEKIREIRNAKKNAAPIKKEKL